MTKTRNRYIRSDPVTKMIVNHLRFKSEGTTFEIAVDLNTNTKAVSNAIYRRPDLFVEVGERQIGHHRGWMTVWALMEES